MSFHENLTLYNLIVSIYIIIKTFIFFTSLILSINLIVIFPFIRSEGNAFIYKKLETVFFVSLIYGFCIGLFFSSVNVVNFLYS